MVRFFNIFVCIYVYIKPISWHIFTYIVLVTFKANELYRFDRWLSRTEEDIDDAVKIKPTTRLEACQSLATFKVK